MEEGFLGRRSYIAGKFWDSETRSAAFESARHLANKRWELVTVLPQTKATKNGATGLGRIITDYFRFIQRPFYEERAAVEKESTET